MAAKIGADKEGVEGLGGQIGESRELGGELAEWLRQMGVDSTADRVQEFVVQLEQALQTQATIAATLEKARHLAASAEHGARGSGTGSYATPLSPQAAADRKHHDRQPTGEELLKQSESQSRGLRGLLRATANPDAADTAKNAGDCVQNFTTYFSWLDPDDPAAVAETQAPTGPVYQPPPQPKVGGGDMAMAFLAASVVSFKAAEVVRNTYRRRLKKPKKWKERD